jgi:hypothetical protein
LQKVTYTGMGVAILQPTTIYQVSWLLGQFSSSLPSLSGGEENSFSTGRSIFYCPSKLSTWCVFTKRQESKRGKAALTLLHKTLKIHNSVIQPDVQNAWPRVELLSNKEFTGWLFTSVLLLMLILIDGISNILAICTEFYEESIVVSWKITKISSLLRTLHLFAELREKWGFLCVCVYNS